MTAANESNSGPLKPVWLAFLLAAGTFVLFSPAIGFDFISYDDNLYVYENTHVPQGLTASGLAYAFRTIDGGSWMPATWISYLLDVTVFGMKPRGFHLTNILLHAASAGLLLLALQRMTKQLWPSALAAALFALHPQRAESVVWIAERKDVLSTFFWMLGLLAYAHHAEKPGGRRMTWVCICLLLGLMAKPMVVSFPVVLLLLDFWPLRRLGQTMAELRAKLWPLLKEKIPLLLICLVAAWATVWSQGSKGAIVAVNSPWYLKILRVTENVGFYVAKHFVPTELMLLYPTLSLDWLHATLLVLLLAAVSGFALWRMFRWPWLSVGWFWFLITLAPVAGFFSLWQISVADRYSYLPSVGLALVTSWFGAELMARWPRSRAGLAGALGGAVLVYSLATWADLPRWQNSFKIFESAYQRGAHRIACNNYGFRLYARQEYQKAIEVCTRGLESDPDYPELYNTRGAAYYVLGDLDRALADYDRAITLKTNYAEAYNNRALVCFQRKQYAETRAMLEKCRDLGGQPFPDLLQALKKIYSTNSLPDRVP